MSRLYARLVAMTELSEPDNPQSCWVWQGTTRPGGYPRFSVRDGKPHPSKRSAHRAILEEVLDAVFPFDEAGHLCGNPSCINPDHLEVQTPEVNLSTRRGYAALVDVKRAIPVLFPRSTDDDIPV